MTDSYWEILINAHPIRNVRAAWQEEKNFCKIYKFGSFICIFERDLSHRGICHSGVFVILGYLSSGVNVVQGECRLGLLSPGVIVSRGDWSRVIVPRVIVSGVNVVEPYLPLYTGKHR